jgi:mRNA degradation ribonuclease J1/J2
MRGFGLPVEKNGEWEIPEKEKGLHASGHACGLDLIRIAREISPRVLIPVHCEKPEFYADNLSGSEIEVKLPSEGKTIEI